MRTSAKAEEISRNSNRESFITVENSLHLGRSFFCYPSECVQLNYVMFFPTRQSAIDTNINNSHIYIQTGLYELWKAIHLHYIEWIKLPTFQIRWDPMLSFSLCTISPNHASFRYSGANVVTTREKKGLIGIATREPWLVNPSHVTANLQCHVTIRTKSTRSSFSWLVGWMMAPCCWLSWPAEATRRGDAE